MIENTSTRRRPTCTASQPVSGIMMAEAMMYEVNTQVI
jgi:hypothetical protein